ncbi:MAG TPA: beta-eliminating lyase-related protein [Acidimicrobiales bacterium]|nr:beta-eliminating lyase-related protein [Acidimicrobiales bacterium]
MLPTTASEGKASETRREQSRVAAPFSRDAVMEAAASSCTRFLAGHGPRRAQTLLATIPTDTEADYYGTGGVVADLEAEVASLLGKQAALFLPTGTMAQQATLRAHADRRASRNIAFHPACHLETNEERGYQYLHGLFGVPVGRRHEPLSSVHLNEVHQPVAALLVELPQRDLGGTLPSWDELVAQVTWARDRGAAAHLDGARLWEATPFYARSANKSLAEIATLFDTVYVSFYKGLGAIAGCCVAGDQDVIDELSIWRTRHGGRCFMLWPYAASALTTLHTRLPLMPKYYRHAVAIGRALKEVPGVELMPARVQSPMMHLRFSVSLNTLRSRAIAIAKSEKVWTFARPFASEGPNLQRVELQVGDATLEFPPDEVRDLIARLAEPSVAKAARTSRAPTSATPARTAKSAKVTQRSKSRSAAETPG